MNVYEFIDFLNRSKSAFTLAVNPAIVFQSQVAQSINPVINFRNNINKNIQPVYQLLEQYKNIQIELKTRFYKIIQMQQDIINNFSSFDFDVPTTQMSPEASTEFTQIYLDTVNDCEINTLTEESPQVEEDMSKPKKITWEQAITIILFIINIIMFIQSQLPEKPNEQLNKIEHSLQQLIDIQTKELELLKDIHE